MSLQAELCVHVLMALYTEFDQRSGWVDHGKLLEHFKKDGVALARTEDALTMLKSLQMIEFKENAIKLSRYGVDWMEKKMPLISRGDTYEFAMPSFRSLTLEGPDTFYGRRSKRGEDHSGINWTKWGTILAGAGIGVTILIAVLA